MKHCPDITGLSDSTMTFSVHTQGVQDLSGHLLYALSHGLVQAVQHVIEEGTSLDLSSPLQCANCQEFTPLSIAALLPSTLCLELLLTKDVVVDGTDNHGIKHCIERSCSISYSHEIDVHRLNHEHKMYIQNHPHSVCCVCRAYCSPLGSGRRENQFSEDSTEALLNCCTQQS